MAALPSELNMLIELLKLAFYGALVLVLVEWMAMKWPALFGAIESPEEE